jgi:hypothetical protein
MFCKTYVKPERLWLKSNRSALCRSLEKSRYQLRVIIHSFSFLSSAFTLYFAAGAALVLGCVAVVPSLAAAFS